MLTFGVEDKRPWISQQIIRPSVYLDHWAVREISDSPILTRRFSEALRRGGTFVLSWLNVVEFSKVSDPDQRHRADSLLSAALPNIFWINPDFLSICKQEQTAPAGLDSAISDLESAKICLPRFIPKTSHPQTPEPQPLFSVIYSRRKIRQKSDELAYEILAQLSRLRRELQTNPETAAALRKPPTADALSRKTNFITRQLLGRLLKDQTLILTRNHAIDLTHAAVSSSFCDYVLLDKHWAASVDDIRAAVEKAGLSTPIAKPFSKKDNGIEHFLDEFESAPRPLSEHPKST